MTERYQNRTEGGRVLAGHLTDYRNTTDAIVLGLPRGGVPVAYEVARGLGLPLDVLNVRKLGVPGQPEMAMGAIATGGIRVIHDGIVQELGLATRQLEDIEAKEREELQQRDARYRGERGPLDLSDKTVILVDDGLATGATMQAAVKAVQTQSPAAVVAAVPVGSGHAVERLRDVTDAVVCPSVPLNFRGVGRWYVDFAQTTDDEVIEIMRETAVEDQTG